MRTVFFLAGLALVTACNDPVEKDPVETDTDTTETDVETDTTETDTTETDVTGVSDEYYTGATSAALGGANNEASCATCHSNDGSSEGYSGDSLKDIAYRTSFKGGDAPDLLSASNACVAGWMGGTALTSTDAAWISLEAYLQSISDEAVTTPNTVMPEVLADEAAYEAAYGSGDATAGAGKYDTTCAKCHDNALVVGPATSYTKATLGAYTVGRIAQKVRTSGPPPSGTADVSDTTPGPMPFFEPDELSATDLADIIAHLKSQ